MAFDAAVLSLIVGLVRRGRISGLADMFEHVWHFWLLLVPFAITIAWFAIGELPPPVKLPIAGWMHILATVAFILFFMFNLRFPGMAFMMVGQMLNLLPIAGNAGRMPVSSAAVLRSGISMNDPWVREIMEGRAIRHVALSDGTRFNFLADIIPVPHLWRLPAGVISPGDFLVAVGLFILIQYAMCSLKKPETGAVDAA